jgi:acetyl-CoA carboxylase biotin carboxyl carrier protein
LDLNALREILEILHERDITDFELEEQGLKLRIRKAVPVAETHPVVSVVSAALPAAVPAASSSAATAPGAAPVAASEEGLHIVKSPIVGTFYRSPDPNSPVFVQVGDRVKQGQTLCIIEAMKLMNDIEADVAGEVVRIHPENGQPVQYGEPLFTLRP